MNTLLLGYTNTNALDTRSTLDYIALDNVKKHESTLPR